jgi:predicted transcriptional regulator
MQTLLTLKVDSRMKAALKKLADKQFISVSAAVKQAVERHLQDHGIDWRKEKTKAVSSK